MTKKNNTFFNISFFIILAMSVLSQHSFGQRCMSMDKCTTVLATLASFSGNTITITAANSDTSLNGLTGKLIYVPSGVTFEGSIDNIDASSVFCIDVGAVFSPRSMNNFSGTIRNYSSSITLNNSFGGNIENYNGTMTVNSNELINNEKYVLNCGGFIQWNGKMNINDGSVYNNGTFTIHGQVSGSGCIFNEDLMIIGSSITTTTDQGYTGTLTLNNNGLLKIPGEMQGTGTVVNQGWMTIGGYVGQNQFTNYGKVEVVGTKLYFNSSGSLNNYCTFYSNTSGAEFQNNQSINNYGLIYLPVGKWHNQNGTFFNGATGIVRTNDLQNEKEVTGSGKFYVSGKSINLNSSAVFGNNGDSINFYDASNTSNPGQFDENSGAISLTGVFYTPFPMPEYTPDLSLYQCGSIVLAGSVHPGTIAASQILCHGINPQGFTSTQDAWVDDGVATITYQWQSSNDSTNFTNISGETDNEYSIKTRPSAKTYYRRRAKATYAGADSIKNSMYGSNIVSLTPVSTPPPSVATNPTSSSVCENSQAQFTASGQNYSSLQWQESQDKGVKWADLSNTIPYSGATTDTLTINPASTSMKDRLYRLALISDNCGTVYSTSAILTVITNDAPGISTHPADQIVCFGSTSAQFSVASSSEVSSYKWQLSTDKGKNWTNCSGDNYSGETTKTLTVNSGGLTNGHQFSCVLTATCNSTTSSAATLYLVNPEVKVTPVDDSIKCPDTDPTLEFNPLDNNYDMGNSRVTFTISRETEGLFEWSFSYSVTADPALLAASQPQPVSETIYVAAGTSSYDLSFYLENQTTSSVDVKMTLSNVSVAGCTESSANNSDHTAKIQVRRLPVSGKFITN